VEGVGLLTLPLATAVRPTHLPHLTGTGEDATLTTMIARADAVLAAWCGYPPASASASPTLESTTYTEYLDGPSVMEPRALVLPVRPVASITTIHDDTDGDWSYDADDLVSSDDYTLDGREGRVYLHDDSTHGSWSSRKRAIKVVFVAGFDTGAHKIIAEAISILAHWWALRHGQGKAAQTAGGQSVTARPETIPDRVRELMAPFRMWEVGNG
jgi:hypothetical protein